MIPAVVLDIPHGGYGVIKSLSRFKIPVYGFYNDTAPETRTRLCTKIRYINFDDLKPKLITLVNTLGVKPVLFLTTDAHVTWFVKNTDLHDLFLFDVPSRDVAANCLNKVNFNRLAINAGLNVPQCYTPHTAQFPCFIKPQLNATTWWEKVNVKGYLCDTANQLQVRVSDSPCKTIIQEWIPGPTSNIHFVMAYYQNGQRLAGLVGRKVREWPIIAGTGCCLEPYDTSELLDISDIFFGQLNFSGFGALEFKQHAITKKWYVIEPTVYRVDLNIEFAAANGVDLPAIAYSTLSGIKLPLMYKRKRAGVWIHEQMDIYSCFYLAKNHQLSYAQAIRTYFRSSFHFLNRRDIIPFCTRVFAKRGKT